MIAWDQWALTVISSTTPVIFYLWRQKEVAKREQEARHADNTHKLNQIIEEQAWLPQHWHGESDGNLTVRGIMRRPQNGD